jgi:hypothetical protein
MPGTITQVQGKAVEPNRNEPEHPFKMTLVKLCRLF